MHTLICSITPLASLELYLTWCTFSIPPNFPNFCTNFQYVRVWTPVYLLWRLLWLYGCERRVLPRRNIVYFILYIPKIILILISSLFDTSFHDFKPNSKRKFKSACLPFFQDGYKLHWAFSYPECSQMAVLNWPESVFLSPVLSIGFSCLG